jgi:hypothetical protein
MGEQAVESFRSTSGRVTGSVGLALVLGVVVMGVVDHEAFPAPMVAGAIVFGVLLWAATLRPRVSVAGDRLVLRNMFETVSIPLASIEEIVVRQVLLVRAGTGRYVSPAVGRSRRQTVRANHAGRPASVETVVGSYPDFVEQRIRQRCDDERAKLGIARYSDEQFALAAEVRREPAWLEITALAVSVLAFVITLVI